MHGTWAGACRVAACCLLLILVGSTVGSGKRKPDPLRQVNERWAGAECRIRFEVPVKKGKDKQGWSKSIWIVPGTQTGKELAGAKLFVSNRDSLPGGRIYPGTSFVAEGWAFDDPKDQDGLRLDLRFADGSGRAYFSFRRGFGKVGAKFLETVERWARMEMFHVSAADEVLAEAPASVEMPAQPVRPAMVARPSPSPPAAARDVELRIMGVSVDPLRVDGGGEIGLIVTYALEGGAAGATHDVLERRVILSGGQVLTTLEATVARAVGTHQSRQALQIPPDVAPGIYELRVTIQSLRSSASGEAIFQVVSADG